VAELERAAARKSEGCAVADPQYPRCSLPGDNDSTHDPTTTSKSKARKRFSNCASSMVRTVTPMPSRSRVGL
jgi:hypothetical protein